MKLKFGIIQNIPNCSANSIWAVELLIQSIKRFNPDTTINSIILDFYLWDMAKKLENQMTGIPIHLTRSIYY